jgi:hypothetical protein
MYSICLYHIILIAGVQLELCAPLPTTLIACVVSMYSIWFTVACCLVGVRAKKTPPSLSAREGIFQTAFRRKQSPCAVQWTDTGLMAG